MLSGGEDRNDRDVVSIVQAEAKVYATPAVDEQHRALLGGKGKIIPFLQIREQVAHAEAFEPDLHFARAEVMLEIADRL